MKTFIRHKLLMTAFVGGWLAATGWGMWRLVDYSFTPGATGTALQNWPADTTLARNADGFTMVVALHPECPCSQATVEELDGILARFATKLQVRALFVDLPGLPEPAANSVLWQRVMRLAGVSLIRDAHGVEARRFGMLTSGETRLYGPDGRLLFQGGITGERGHAGDNPGQGAVMTWLANRPSLRSLATAPVFGCAIWDECIAPPSSSP